MYRAVVIALVCFCGQAMAADPLAPQMMGSTRDPCLGLRLEVAKYQRDDLRRKLDAALPPDERGLPTEELMLRYIPRLAHEQPRLLTADEWLATVFGRDDGIRSLVFSLHNAQMWVSTLEIEHAKQ